MGKKPFVVLRFPNEELRTFSTATAFQAWLDECEGHWKWFFGAPANVGAANVARNAIREFLDGARQQLNEAKLAKDDEKLAIHTNAIQSLSDSMFPVGNPLDPNDAMVSVVDSHFRTFGEEARAIGVGTAIYIESSRTRIRPNLPLNDVAHPMSLRAIALSVAVREGAAPGARGLIAKATTKAANVADRIEAASQEASEAHEKALGELVAATQATTGEVLVSIQARTNDAVQRIDETREKYAEVMRLKAPVDYWATKSTDHKTGVRTYRRWLTGLSICALPLLALVYFGGWTALNNFSKVDAAGAVAMTLYVAGFVGAVTAVVLWFIRIVVRLYMSQHHLAADAEERASMLRTYLSLTESGKVSEEERALVLASIFRPVPDGIVKDDGAPAYSPAGLLAMLMDRK